MRRDAVHRERRAVAEHRDAGRAAREVGRELAGGTDGEPRDEPGRPCAGGEDDDVRVDTSAGGQIRPGGVDALDAIRQQRHARRAGEARHRHRCAVGEEEPADGVEGAPRDALGPDRGPPAGDVGRGELGTAGAEAGGDGEAVALPDAVLTVGHEEEHADLPVEVGAGGQFDLAPAGTRAKGELAVVPLAPVLEPQHAGRAAGRPLGVLDRTGVHDGHGRAELGEPQGAAPAVDPAADHERTHGPLIPRGAEWRCPETAKASPRERSWLSRSGPGRYCPGVRKCS